MFHFRFRWGYLFRRCYEGARAPSIPRTNRPIYFSILIPIGLSIKNRYLIQCHQSIMGRSDAMFKRLRYYDVPAAIDQQTKNRNWIVKIILGVYRLIRIYFRLVQLLITFVPLLIAYVLMRRNYDRSQKWRRWALYLVEISGPAVVKLAQWASTRRDLFSKEFCDLFSQLHTSTRTHDFARTEKLLKDVLGDNWRDYFLEFDEKCCGSGCVAQVHKAQLNYVAVQRAPLEIRKQFDSCERPCIDVAIKVTHPGVKRAIADDLAILSGLVSILQLILPKSRYIDPNKCLQEFRAALIRQIDLRFEGDALRVFSQQFENDESIHFPKPLFQTEDVLIETFEEGNHISNYQSSSDTELKRKLATLGMDALLKMVFVNNFVHGDLHPGNILVQDYFYKKPKSKGVFGKIGGFVQGLVTGGGGGVTYVDEATTLEKRTRLVFLDAGISVRLSERDLKNLRAVFKSVVNGDGARVGDLILHYSPQQYCKDEGAFKKDLQALVSKATSGTVSLRTLDVSSLLSDLLDTVSRHRVTLEPNFTCVILAVLVLEGLGRSLYPQLDLIEQARPVLLRVL